MKKISLILLSVLFSMLYSCEKVIDVNVKEIDSEIMIEGIVSDDPSEGAKVIITKSLSIGETSEFPSVSGATVIINDDLGNSFVLLESSAGSYTNSTLVGVPGRTYSLSINVEGKIYTATSKMPTKVNLDTVNVDEITFPGIENGKSIVPVFTDPIGLGNYYRFKLKRNSTISKNIFLGDDQIIDGLTNSIGLIDQNMIHKSGDTAEVTLICIDSHVYTYFYSMNQNLNGSTASPANPVTNIQGAKLGYFSAQASDTKFVIVP